MNKAGSIKSVFYSFSKGFLMLVLSLFLGTITSCDFKHSLQHQFGFETTSNQNISKTTIDKSCDYSRVIFSESVSIEIKDKQKQKTHDDFTTCLFSKVLESDTYLKTSREDGKSFTEKHCPLFILYKKRKVLSTKV